MHRLSATLADFALWHKVGDIEGVRGSRENLSGQ